MKVDCVNISKVRYFILTFIPNDGSPFFLDLFLLCVHCYKSGSHIPTTVYGFPLKLAFISHRNGSGHSCFMFDTIITTDSHKYCMCMKIFSSFFLSKSFRTCKTVEGMMVSKFSPMLLYISFYNLPQQMRMSR